MKPWAGADVHYNRGVAGTDHSPDVPGISGVGATSAVAREAVLAEPPETSAPGLPAPELRRRALVGAVLVGLRGIGIRIFGLAGNVALARLLVPAEFGTVALALGVLALAGVFFDGGLGASLIRRDREPTSIELRNVLGIQLATAAVLGGAVATVGVVAGGAGDLAAVMMLALPLMALRTPGIVLLERRLAFGPIAAVEVGEVAAYYLWAVGAAVLGFGVLGVATASVVKAAVGTATLLRAVPEGLVRPAISPQVVRSLLGFGLRVQAVDAIRVVRDQGLNAATFAIAGASALGLWTLATRVLQVPFVLFEPLWRVSFPAMSQLIATGEDPRPIMERGVRVIAAATGLVATVLASASPALIPGVFGAPWSDAAPAVAFACIGLQLNGPISVVTAGYLFASGRADVVVRSVAAQAVAWAAIALPLLPLAGPTALGIGCIGAGIAEAAIFSRAARRLAGARLLAPQALPLVVTVVASAAGWIAVSVLAPTVTSAAIGALLGAGIYGSALLVFKRALLLDVLALGRRAFGGSSNR